MQGSAGAERVVGNGGPITGEELKALKGKAHERWKLKDASKVRGADSIERVAKPCGWDFRASRAKPLGRWIERSGAEKGSSVRKCCRAVKLKRGAFEKRTTVDVGRRYEGGRKKETALRWRQSAEEENRRLISIGRGAAGNRIP
jgi:hypothetical protein